MTEQKPEYTTDDMVNNAIPTIASAGMSADELAAAIRHASKRARVDAIKAVLERYMKREISHMEATAEIEAIKAQ